MSLMASYVDGKLQTSTTSSDSLSAKKDNSVVDSDTFLTLLVAEMQNQDPLEPTSNTEWVSQYATFTQVQQMSEMADSMDLVRANSLIGKEVIMKVTSESTGETSYKRGTVDYVVVEDGKPLVVIDEAKYSLSDLDTVASDEYFGAYDKYTEFVNKLAALPSLKVIDSSYKNTVQDLMDLYNGMSDYEKNYLEAYAAGEIESYKAYVKQLEDLGVTFTIPTETKETTLDDLLSAFDKKMTALMEQIAALKDSSSTASIVTLSSADTSDTNKSDSASGNESGVTDSAGSTEGSESTQGNTEATGNATPAEDNKDSVGEVNNTEENASSTEDSVKESDNTASTGNESNKASDESDTQAEANSAAEGSTVTDETPSDNEEDLAELLTKDTGTV